MNIKTRHEQLAEDVQNIEREISIKVLEYTSTKEAAIDLNNLILKYQVALSSLLIVPQEVHSASIRDEMDLILESNKYDDRVKTLIKAMSNETAQLRTRTEQFCGKNRALEIDLKYYMSELNKKGWTPAKRGT